MLVDRHKMWLQIEIQSLEQTRDLVSHLILHNIRSPQKIFFGKIHLILNGFAIFEGVNKGVLAGEMFVNDLAYLEFSKITIQLFAGCLILNVNRGADC